MTNLNTNILPYDPASGVPLPVLPVDDRTAVATFTVAQLLDLVPEPVASENAKIVAIDQRMKEYAEVRSLVQRWVEGAKAKNAISYAEYLIEGTQGRRPWMVPAITLFTPEQLRSVAFPGGMAALLLGWGKFLVAIDGETQRIAWGLAVKRVPALRERRVAVIIHHGKTLDEARQGFHDLNTKEVKPNAAVALSMDTLDPANRIARQLIEHSDVLRGRVNGRLRQLRQHDHEVLTLSALRTAIVTTLLGRRGFQAGTRSITELLPPGIDLPSMIPAVLDVWGEILGVIGDALAPERRSISVASAPSILAGMGVLAHNAMPKPLRSGEPQWDVEDVISRLEGVIWDREVRRPGQPPSYPWLGVGGKVTPSGGFSVGGPKEVGTAVASALEDLDSVEGRRIRGADLHGASESDFHG